MKIERARRYSYNMESNKKEHAGGSSSSPRRTGTRNVSSFYESHSSSSFYTRNNVSGLESTRALQESSEAFQHPPLRRATFPNASSNKASLQNNLLSPMPYEDEHHLDYSRDGRSKKKRPRWTQSEYSSFLQCLDTAGDDATAEPTYDTTPHTTSNDIANAKHSERRHTNHEFLSATLNFPYKEFISKNDKDHIKIWNDDEKQTRLERHFNPKWQVDFLSMFYSPEGKVHEERTPTTTTKSQKDEKVVSDTTLFKPIQAKEKRKEVILVDATNKDASNTDKSNSFSPISLEEAAENLCDAMDVSDVTRDAIARIENQMQINRRVFLIGE